jgi:hypothetical protein
MKEYCQEEGHICVVIPLRGPCLSMSLIIIHGCFSLGSMVTIRPAYDIITPFFSIGGPDHSIFRKGIT